MTLALAESAPGLRIGSVPQDLTPIDHHDGQAVFFLGGNFQAVLGDTDLKPGWHDVVQQGEASPHQSYARWAIVAFIDGHAAEGAPEEMTHKWRVGQESKPE